MWRGLIGKSCGGPEAEAAGETGQWGESVVHGQSKAPGKTGGGTPEHTGENAQGQGTGVAAVRVTVTGEDCRPSGQ